MAASDFCLSGPARELCAHSWAHQGTLSAHKISGKAWQRAASADILLCPAQGAAAHRPTATSQVFGHRR